MKNKRELTFRVIILSILLTVVLATSNAYLALKIGILTSASIPAAILSMGILRFFKNSSILENNLVQTAASAGEAVAGGIVYTVPALIIIHYWFGFSYWENFWIALLGGVLGVLFSIPLRRFLVTDPHLPFPEGMAIAEILKMSEAGGSFRCLVKGSLVGGLIELCQTGFKIIADQWQSWWLIGSKTIAGFGVGYSPALTGAGYLIGFEAALNIFAGAVLSWVITVPIMSQFFPDVVQQVSNVNEAAGFLWSTKIRYIAIGTMLTAGIGAIFSLVKPLIRHVKQSINAVNTSNQSIGDSSLQDIPWRWNVLGLIIAGLGLIILFHWILPFNYLALTQGQFCVLIAVALIYIFVIGFIMSGITGYFSGLVGVSASPGSSVIIAGLLFIGFILVILLEHWIASPWTSQQTLGAEAVAILIGAILTGIACIANDNIQDLKVGHLIHASPWKQQIMLLLGVIIASLVIPPVMQVLFQVYGIADVFPHAGMDLTQALPAPPAAMMAALTQAVFSHQMPWNYLGIGFVVAVILLLVRHFVPSCKKLSVLAVGIGMYLPLASSIPLFVGGGIAGLCKDNNTIVKQNRTLLACGLLAGSALMNVILAIPFAITSNPNILKATFLSSVPFWNIISGLSGIGVWILSYYWFKNLGGSKKPL